MNKITGMATPGQVIGLLCQAFASGVAYILEGKKKPNQATKKRKKNQTKLPTTQTKSNFTHRGGNLRVLHNEKRISALAAKNNYYVFNCTRTDNS